MCSVQAVSGGGTKPERVNACVGENTRELQLQYLVSDQQRTVMIFFTELLQMEEAETKRTMFLTISEKMKIYFG